MTDASSLRALREENRLSWNEATRAHNSHKGDQAAFFRAGGNKLFPEERELLGDVRGKRVLHLQCNSGQDTLSIAQLGAQATGVDISDEAITFAQKLAAASGIAAALVRSDIYDWLQDAAAADKRWDIAFCSYGAICWLPDLTAWARGVAGVLTPGGRFVAVEFHPMLSVLSEDWSLAYDYFGEGQPQTWEEGVSDYVAASPALAGEAYRPGIVDFKNPYRVHQFQWPTSEVVAALLGAGLVLESFREYPYTNGWRAYPGMREGDGGRWYPPHGVPSLPLMYSVAARKAG